MAGWRRSCGGPDRRRPDGPRHQQNIVAKGFELKILGHRNHQADRNLVKLGATGRRPARISPRTATLVLCVTGSPEVEDVILRKDACSKDCIPAWSSPIAALRNPDRPGTIAADLFARAGASSIRRRAPQGGGGRRARPDDWQRFDDIPEIRPVLECFADTIIHAGPGRRGA